MISAALCNRSLDTYGEGMSWMDRSPGLLQKYISCLECALLTGWPADIGRESKYFLVEDNVIPESVCSLYALKRRWENRSLSTARLAFTS